MLRPARLVLSLLLTCAVLAPMAWADDADLATRLLGYWLCESGDCPDEALEFANNDGVQTYNSWLHDRPSAVDGRWSLEGSTLAINCCEDLDYQYTVVEASDEQLVLRDIESPGEKTVLRRPPAAGTSGEKPAANADAAQ